MLKDIEALLNDGMTPEQLYTEAVRINEAKAAAKEKMEKKVADARDTMLNALNDYVEVLLGEKPDKELMKELDDSFKVFEESVKSFDKMLKSSKTKGLSNEDDAIWKFLKNIGAMG